MHELTTPSPVNYLLLHMIHIRLDTMLPPATHHLKMILRLQMQMRRRVA